MSNFGMNRNNKRYREQPNEHHVQAKRQNMNEQTFTRKLVKRK